MVTHCNEMSDMICDSYVCCISIMTISWQSTLLCCSYAKPKVIIIIIIFVHLIADLPHYLTTNIHHAGRHTAATMQGSAIYRRVKRVNCMPQTALNGWRITLVLISWTLIRWRYECTPDKVAHCSICRPRKDERLSWHSWLTCSVRFTHINGHSSAASQA